MSQAWFNSYVQQSVNAIKDLPDSQSLRLGEQTLKQLKAAGFMTIWDLLCFYPKQIIDLERNDTGSQGVENSENDKKIAKKVTLVKCVRNLGKIKFLITFKDQHNVEGKIVILSSKLPMQFFPGKQILIYGACENNSFLHPTILPLGSKSVHKYNLQPPLFDKTISKIVSKVLEHPSMQQMVDQNLSWKDAFSRLHFGSAAEQQAVLKVLKKLEAHAYSYVSRQDDVQHKIDTMSHLTPPAKEIYDQIHSILTPCQTQCVQEITTDFQSNKRSKRIIFGDVGTGKTLVTLLAALFAVSAGKRVLFMVPTTLLAKQVFSVFSQKLQNLCQISLFTQKTKQSTDAQIIIGTHALLEQNFDNVGLIIIDEQHKFGVKQRMKIVSKDNLIQAHLLSLSATPIPRTLFMALKNFLSVSILRIKPKPVQIETLLTKTKNIDALATKIKDELGLKEAVYWVCPAVEDEEQTLGYMNVTQRFQHLQQLFGDRVGLLHGQMKKEEQEEVYAKVMEGEVNVIVCTTVVEVGIDIPHANLIIIEDAQRFGLAQLHQLRGRVGRAGKPGKCILVHGQNLSKVSVERLQAMKNLSDGFSLAQRDMEIRGYGNVFTQEQTGYYEFTFLDMPYDSQLLIDCKPDSNSAHSPLGSSTDENNLLAQLAELFFLPSAAHTI